MPATQQHGIDAERFAALWAGCDTGNNNEAEAVSKFREVRRMVAKEAAVTGNSLRLIDAIFLPHVWEALDAQMQPVRDESPEVKALEIKVTELANALAEEREIASALRAQVARRAAPASSPDTGLVNGGLVAVLVVIALALMIAGALQ